MINYAYVLVTDYSNLQFTMENEEDYDTLVVHNGEKPSKAELDGLLTKYHIREAIKEAKLQIEAMLDATAQEYGFDSILSARSYTGYYNKYQAIAGRLSVWAAEVWEVVEEAHNKGVTSLEEIKIPEFKEK